MPEFSRTIIGLFQKRAATEQVWTIIDGRFFRVKAFFIKGGLLSGKDPSAFNPNDPIRLWIIQVGTLIAMLYGAIPEVRNMQESSYARPVYYLWR